MSDRSDHVVGLTPTREEWPMETFMHLYGKLIVFVYHASRGPGLAIQHSIYRAKTSASTCDDCVLKIDLFNGIKQ
jgi:hypothetical protein